MKVLAVALSEKEGKKKGSCLMELYIYIYVKTEQL